MSDTVSAEKKIAWVGFPNGVAKLKRVNAPNGVKGILLRTDDSEKGRDIRDRAIAHGFGELKASGLLRKLFSDGIITETPRSLINALGGELLVLSRDELNSAEWTLNLSAKAPGAPKPESKKQPDSQSMIEIGINAAGEDVLNDSQGRFVRRYSPDGEMSFIHESDEPGHLTFLRAKSMDDLLSISAALMMSAERGVLHEDVFNRVLDAAIETIDGADRAACAARLRENMLRQIASVSTEGNASRDAFAHAMRLASNTSFILSRETKPGDVLSPSPAMTVFLRRQFAGVTELDFHGHDDMRMALPRLLRESAKVQFHDLADIADDDISTVVNNLLGRRAPDGRTVLRFSSESEDAVERLRHQIGTIYALEAVADVSPVASDGARSGQGSKLMFIGEIRPQPLEALPQAALRSFSVVTADDFLNLERDILRSRAKIREFHNGEVADIEAAEDTRAENARQQPYQPLSSLREPFTMIPMALEGATSKALMRARANFEDHGGADAAVAAALGESLESLPEVLSAEQIDAVALQLTAQERDRGFLLGDQTGVGKGRSLAAFAKAWLRKDPENKVFYFTESPTINIPDVCRDFKAVGAWNSDEALFLSAGTVLENKVLDEETGEPLIDPDTGEEVKEVEKTAMPASARHELMKSGEWPDRVRVMMTTYTQFRGKDDDPSTTWIDTALGEKVMVLFDEAHNGLNPSSRQGGNLRRIIAAVPDGNVIYGTATPFRDPKGVDLYTPLLSGNGAEEIKELTDGVAVGGEAAQEVFATMLAEDGVFLRRDHDLSNVDFRVALPDDETIRRYQEQMNTISPVVELMIEASGAISERLGRLSAREYQRARARGLNHSAARAASNELNQYSIPMGSPLSLLSRIAMNAIKVDQVVDAALAEIEEGRKPLITFHSTNEALLKEMSRGVDWAGLESTLLSDIDGEIRLLSTPQQAEEPEADGDQPEADGDQVDENEAGAGDDVAEVAQEPQPVEISEADREMIAALRSRKRLISQVFQDRAKNNEEWARENLTAQIEAIGFERDRMEEIAIRIQEAFESPKGPTLDSAMEEATNLSLRDQIKRIHAGMYRIRMDGKRVDAREIYPDIAEMSDMVMERIAEISPELAVSPVDALIDRLEENGVSVGEISGRGLRYRNNRIERRPKEERNKRKNIDAFNSGGLDVLIYNGAGATGGSFHSSVDFKDQRPRTMIELEAPTDVIKYVQSQGRGNRFGQVHNPRIVSVVTGLTPEMRILQQRNRKLRMLGASVDGNRSHPLLLDDVPDLLNKVGDEATKMVLVSSPAMARRLGFGDIIEKDEAEARVGRNVADNGTGAQGNEIESLANKVLTRSIMLSGPDQDDLVNRIRLEFDAMIEELDSRNENPLRPKELSGQIEVRATALFSGVETDATDLNISAFKAPLYIKTGIHHFTEKAWTGEDLVDQVERTKRVYGNEGFGRQAEMLKQNLPTLLRPYLQEGQDIEQSMAAPEAAGRRFERHHKKLTDLIWLLENITPGVAMRFDDPINDKLGLIRHTVVGLVPPRDPRHIETPSAYKVKLASPGMGRAETMSLSRIMLWSDIDRIRFAPGISVEYSESYLEEFNAEAQFERQMPVQILSGNILRAISESAQNDLGAVSLWRDRDDHIYRGIVVPKSKIDLGKLPVRVPSGPHAAEMAHRFLDNEQYREIAGNLRFYGDEGNVSAPEEISAAEIYLSLTPQRLIVQLPPLRKKVDEFYRSRPGLYELVYEEALPAQKDVPSRVKRRKAKGGRSHYDVSIDVTTEEGKARAMDVLSRMSDMSSYIDGQILPLPNYASQDIERLAGYAVRP